jgi:UDP:flavonoid glycosyltransferase YjiC (YdhE family)
MRFLMTSLPTNDLGLLARSLPLARELESRGHQVTFSNPAHAPRKAISAAGFANCCLAHPYHDLAGLERHRWIDLVRQLNRWCHQSQSHWIRELARVLYVLLATPSGVAGEDPWDADHAAMQLGLGFRPLVELQLELMLRVLDEHRPDVVVDCWNPCAVLAARIRRIPVVTLIQADAHPASAGFRWWEKAPLHTPTPIATVNEVGRKYGLPTLQRVADLSVGDLTLVVGSPEFDPLPPSAQQTVTYVGSLQWHEPARILPPSVSGLKRDRPVVWLYPGTLRYGLASGLLDSEALLTAAIDALGDEALHVVLSLGYRPIRWRQALPANFIVESFVPGSAMAAFCDVLLHHGGYGSCQLGLHAARPAVIAPTFAERESNARRMRGLGAACMVQVRRMGDRKFIDPHELRMAVRHALRTPAMGEAARRAGSRLRTLGGVQTAANAIDDFFRLRSH